MANEYQTLATVYELQTDVEVEVKLMFQEDGGRGIEIVITGENGEIIDVFQSHSIIPPHVQRI